MVVKALSIVLHRIGHRTLLACRTRIMERLVKHENGLRRPKACSTLFSLFDFRCCWTQIGLRHQDVAAKVLYMSVLCELLARFRVRKNQDLAHS